MSGRDRTGTASDEAPRRFGLRLTRGRMLRWGIYVGVLVLLWVFVFGRFSFSIVGEGAAAMAPALRPSGRYLVDTSPPELLLRDSIVFWRTADKNSTPCYSRVRGLPGDRLRRVGGEWEFEDPEGGRHPLPRGLEVHSASDGSVVPERHYFLLNDDLEPARFLDSRLLGPIARERIQARILFSFF